MGERSSLQTGQVLHYSSLPVNRRINNSVAVCEGQPLGVAHLNLLHNTDIVLINRFDWTGYK